METKTQSAERASVARKFDTLTYKCNKTAAFLTLFAVVALLYMNSVKGVFIYDSAPALKSRSVSVAAVKGAMEGSTLFARLLPNLSLAINHHFAGNNPISYHIINILLHMLNSLFVFIAGFKILTISYFKGAYRDGAQKIALVAALLFAAHPIALFATTYITHRMTLLYALFYLLSFTSFIDYKTAGTEESEKKNLIICIVSGALALFCRETAVMMIPLFFIFDILFFSEGQAEIQRKIIPYLIVTLAVTLFLGFALPLLHDPTFLKELKLSVAEANFTGIERILTSFRAIFLYASLLVYPAQERLGVEHNLTKSLSLFNPPTTMICVVLTIALFFVAISLRKKKPLVTFLIFWWFLNLALESTIIPLDKGFLHRVYISSFALFFGAGFFAIKLLDKLSKLPNSAIFRRISIILFIVVIMLLSKITIEKNRTFSSKLTLWEDAYKIAPDKEDVIYNLATAYLEAKRYKIAESLYKEILEKNGGNAMALFGLGNSYYAQGKDAVAEKEYLKAIDADPLFIGTYDMMAELYLKVRRFDLAIKQYRNLLKLDPKSYFAYNSLANIYYRKGELLTAVEYYLKGAQVAPDNPYLHYNAAKVYEELRDFRAALKEYETVLDIDIGFEFKEEVDAKIRELIKKY